MSLSRPTDHGMTAEDFAAWSEAQPGDTRYELLDGEVVIMAPERIVHARMKGDVYVQFRDGRSAVRGVS